MTTTKPRRTGSKIALTPTQAAAVRQAYDHLCRGSSQQREAADELKRCFARAWPAEDTPLFGGDHHAIAMAGHLPPAFGGEYDYDQRPTAYTRYTPAPFPGRAALAELHPRVQAFTECADTPSRPFAIGADPKWQLDCLWERWRYRLGEVPYARWSKEIKPALQVHAFVDLWNAIEAFREHVQQQRTVFGNKLALFLDALPHHVAIGRLPYRNEFGDYTTRGRAVHGERL